MEEERLRILEMVRAGEINTDEAAALLAALGEAEAQDSPPVEVIVEEPATAPPPDIQANRWARFWIYPMMAGGGVLLVGALIMALVYASDAARGWLVCGWLPMILGLGVTLAALWSRNATWLHLRISEGEGGRQKIAFSFPLPLALAAWGIRIAQPFVPQLQETGVDEVILALRESRKQNEPLFIDVQDEEDGERVQIYIG
ncbi:MAG: hypothetical protein P8129_02840 [Anaerolineae bacterium]|jgi:hypothetical protein